MWNNYIYNFWAGCKCHVRICFRNTLHKELRCVTYRKYYVTITKSVEKRRERARYFIVYLFWQSDNILAILFGFSLDREFLSLERWSLPTELNDDSCILFLVDYQERPPRCHPLPQSSSRMFLSNYRCPPYWSLQLLTAHFLAAASAMKPRKLLYHVPWWEIWKMWS